MQNAIDDIIARIEATKAKAEELGRKNTKLVKELDLALVRLAKARAEVDEPPKKRRNG